jgi:hypothetical protein
VLVLEGQIKVLKTESYNFGTKYGCWSELMKDIHMDGDIIALTVEEAMPNVSANPPVTENVPVEEAKTEPKLRKKSLVAAAEEDFDRAGVLQETIDIDLPEDILVNAVSNANENLSFGNPVPLVSILNFPRTEFIMVAPIDVIHLFPRYVWKLTGKWRTLSKRRICCVMY